MATLTPEQWLKQNSPKEDSTSKKLSPEEYLASKSGTIDNRVPTAKVQTPEEYLQDKQITTTKKQSTLGKVAEFLAPTITQTVGKYKKGEDITSKDIIGSGLEAASYLIPVGAVAKGATLATKATKLAIGGAVSGGMFEAGGAIADGGTVSDVTKRTLKGAAIGGVAGGAIGAIGAGLATRKLGQKADEQLLQEATSIVDSTPTTEVSNTVVPNVAPEVAPVTPEVVKPITHKPVSYTKDPVQSLAKTMETELPPDTDPTFIKTTLDDQIAKYDSVASVTPIDDLIDMSMGIKPLPEGLSPVTIHKLTTDRVDLTVEQAMRLKNIYPLSKAGQELSLARLKSGAIIDNPVDMMQSVEKEMKEQVVKRVISKNDIKNLFPDCGFN